MPRGPFVLFRRMARRDADRWAARGLAALARQCCSRIHIVIGIAKFVANRHRGCLCCICRQRPVGGPDDSIHCFAHSL